MENAERDPVVEYSEELTSCREASFAGFTVDANGGSWKYSTELLKSFSEIMVVDD